VTENSDWSDVEAQLQETKELLAEIEQRFLQVRGDSMRQQELQIQQEQIKTQIQDISGDRNLKNNNQNNNQKIRRKPNSKNLNSGDLRSHSTPHKEELLKQLQELGEQIEQIEADLESRLLSWSSFREPFWQIVRFVGIGIIIGVVLRSCAA